MLMNIIMITTADADMTTNIITMTMIVDADMTTTNIITMTMIADADMTTIMTTTDTKEENYEICIQSL